MAGVYKRATDKARGKAGKWTIWWLDADGRRKYQTATTDRTLSLEMANRLEAEAKLVREGLVDPAERNRRKASQRPLADHVEDYRRELLAKDDGAKHAKHVAGVLKRLLADAEVSSVAEIAPDRVRETLGRWKVDKSARTCNHAIGAIKAFVRWLEHANRIKEAPRGILKLKPYNEESDRKRQRRALTPAELAKLLEAAEAGPTEYIYGPTKSKHSKIAITGPDRAALYRLAMGTGFRANEIRSLTLESFSLDGDVPSVTVEAAYSKNGKRAVQPITKDLAAGFQLFVARCEPGKRVLVVPDRTSEMLRRDLERAGIPYEDGAGRVVDFHALRHSFITHLIAAGVNPKLVQTLARHSTITLTLDRYTHVEDGDVRGALEKGQANPVSDASDDPAPR